MQAKFVNLTVLAILLICRVSVCLANEIPDANGTTKYLDAVREFADNVLKYGWDTYGPKHTPLFVDGLNVNTHEPVKWRYKGQVWILSNLASQQNLFRTLDGLTTITSDPKYRQAAVEAIKYAFENLRSSNGLLHWGGHVAYDAQTDEICRGQYVHELKHNYPYYELMWQVDSKATKQFIESFWSAHIMDWSSLAMNRHGGMQQRSDNTWNHEYEGGPVFFESTGLSFLNTGSDLFYAGAMLYNLSGQDEPLVWSKRLAYRYVEARDPKTGIAGTKYTRLRTDRAESQFGDDFQGHLVLEGTLWPPHPQLPGELFRQLPRHILFESIARPKICQLLIGERLGSGGREFTQWALEELTACGKVAYRKKDNSFIPMLTDGTSLEGYVYTKGGYFGPKGTVVEPIPAGPLTFWAYTLTYRVTGEEFLWEMTRSIARGNNLGDIGRTPMDEPKLEIGTDCSSPHTLLGFLELHRKSKKKAFLEMASRIGDNILANRCHKGFFVPSKEHLYTKFDYVEPLVLLHLDRAVNARSSLPPQVWPSRSFFACPYDAHEGGEDTVVIYTRTKSAELSTLLHESSWDGKIDRVKSLISKVANVKVQAPMALHYATENGHKDIMELLIVKGANVNAKNAAGQTPLHYAAERGLKDIAEMLIANGVDVNARNIEGQTPVDIALSRNRMDVVKLLIKKGADVSLHLAVRIGALAKVKSLIEKGAAINAKDGSGQTAMHYAADMGRKEIVEVLLANGADVDAIDRTGRTPAEHAFLDGHSEIIELLISNGADVYPLYLAVSMRDLDKVRRLIRDGADVNKRTQYGTTAIYIAAYAGFRDITELLIDKGADVNAEDSWDWTPLHSAAGKGHRELAELLIIKGANVNARDGAGRTPLWYAKDKGHDEIVELLRKHAAKEDKAPQSTPD
ncbi:MAG: ankyrin repeat domain-containing protein [Planctomycetes bacterium]|nr:ankyrin repeat domain-containing protein [Planctomycetota bacterium]MBL7146803.1 ankyrin repeat domain-containing protein [Phycisphaerae bacterium]